MEHKQSILYSSNGAFLPVDKQTKDQWTQLKKRIIRKNPAIGRTLHLAKLIMSDGQFFHISFSPEDQFAQKMIMTHQNLQWIERVFAPMKVIIVDTAYGKDSCEIP